MSTRGVADELRAAERRAHGGTTFCPSCRKRKPSETMVKRGRGVRCADCEKKAKSQGGAP